MTGRAPGLLGLGLLAVLLVGCTAVPEADPTPTARAVSSDEAQLLASARFTNYDRGTRPFSTELAVSGVDTRVVGWVDYDSAVGYASVTGSFGAEALLWTDAAVGAIPRDPEAD
ncbi:hypothetical protein FJ656_04350, partial [Schumannella luteola]